MDNKKSRKHLKSLFRAGSIPTDADFGKLIDSIPNLVDDQIEYRADGTLGPSICIGAGENRVLMSFFQSLNQAGSNWTLQLTPSNGLSIHAKNRTAPVIAFDAGGNVGIGTDRPVATLDVRGNVQATSQKLTGDLKVGGTVTTGALVISGLGTITDANSLRRLIGYVPPTTTPNQSVAHPRPPAWPISVAMPIQLPPQQISNAVTTNDQAAVVNQQPADHATTPQLEGGNFPATVDETALATTAWVECSVPAGRQWQDVAGPFKGLKVIVVVAWVLGSDNRSVCHVTAVNVDGDPSSGAITHTRSYQGRPGSKITFRWNGNKNGYFLQCRTAVRFAAGVPINLKLHEIL